ncbi:MAG: hypothetical protein DDT31_01428 [Syntrophomonadaceae bacterium]|nr:hypothetical protein [Bacillota bacterium]
MSPYSLKPRNHFSQKAEILRAANKIEAELEMLDRLIAATALLRNATLITRDKTLRESGIVSTIW